MWSFSFTDQCQTEKMCIRDSTTKDHIVTELKDEGDNYYFKLVIDENQQVEFFGKMCIRDSCCGTECDDHLLLSSRYKPQL